MRKRNVSYRIGSVIAVPASEIMSLCAFLCGIRYVMQDVLARREIGLPPISRTQAHGDKNARVHQQWQPTNWTRIWRVPLSLFFFFPVKLILQAGVSMVTPAFSGALLFSAAPPAFVCNCCERVAVQTWPPWHG